MESIVVALITGGLSLIGVIITSRSNGKKLQQQLEIAQAVTDTKIVELTREVRDHNNFAKRVPVLEEKMKVANHRIDDLERRKEHSHEE
jgi:hypothetical protein